MAERNVLSRLRDIDRCLDIGDSRGFNRASHELRDVLRRLRDRIDNTSVADIIAFTPLPRAAGAA